MLAFGNSGMTVTDLASVTPPAIAAGSHTMTQRIDLPPGDAGVGPHRHSGPVFGYVLEGRILFELEGEAPYFIDAGQAFWEPGGAVVHYQAANALPDKPSSFLAVCICAPDVPMITMLSAEEIAERAHLRVAGP